jgi:hypothetical protein
MGPAATSIQNDSGPSQGPARQPYRSAEDRNRTQGHAIASRLNLASSCYFCCGCLTWSCSSRRSGVRRALVGILKTRPAPEHLDALVRSLQMIGRIEESITAKPSIIPSPRKPPKFCRARRHFPRLYSISWSRPLPKRMIPTTGGTSSKLSQRTVGPRALSVFANSLSRARASKWRRRRRGPVCSC